ncbi:MAG: hypothetical protein ACRD3T_05615 [Terriglobia bacterium]
MKSPFRLSGFLLTGFLLVCACLPGNAWSGALQSPSNTASAFQSSREVPAAASASVTIPGPLRPFLRMAAISQEVSSEQVLPLLARNVIIDGYEGQGKGRKPTEYLILVKRYLKQARELVALAGPEQVIRISKCSEAQPLLTTLGYRLRQPCGPNTSLEPADPKRAFLTIDSGFPLTRLEDMLRGGKPFVYSYSSSQAPVLGSPADWIAHNKDGKDQDVIDSLLRDPDLARLYWALARIDGNTRAYLERSPGLEKLVPLAPVLDFYGSSIYIQGGNVVVPGGYPAKPAWKSLVGASPDAPGKFVPRLLEKDEGWLAAYFDALSRVNGNQQAYFTEPQRLRRFYSALRGRNISPGPARPVFRPDPGLLLLVTRLQLDPSGQPRVPGNLEVWKEILRQKSDSKLVREWGRRARRWHTPEQLVAGMFALSRVNTEDSPLQMFLTLSEVDRGRSPQQRLSPQTVRLLAEKFSRFSDQYPIFAEFHALNNTSITRFINVAEDIDRIRDRALRGDARGIFEANAGLWQILARQQQIPSARWNNSWQRVIYPFARVRSSAQLFDAAQSSLREMLRAAGANPRLSQDGIIALLAGPDQTTPEGQQVRQYLANKIRSVLDAQRLVSLDTIFALADGFNQMARGEPAARNLIGLVEEVQEFQLPKPLFTSGERIAWTAGLSANLHLQAEMTTDLTSIIKSPGSRKVLAAACGQLVPFLRDTLVGLNYAYYQPPGAQLLYNDPLFIRSHDFSGEVTEGDPQAWQTPSMVGRGWAAAGGAHLSGSLADLPYVLAEVEQDFIVPVNVQSLIWEDMVPSLLVSSVLPRWWRVTRPELHAVALYQRYGEELLTAAGKNEQLGQRVMNILSDRLLPQRIDQVEEDLRSGHPETALSQLTPDEKFYLAAQFRRRFADQANKWGKAGQDLEKLAQRDPGEVSLERLSEDFGVPHPALALTYATELLNVKPFPTFMGYSSRLLAESWESNNLYWARLADEKGYSPVMLDLLVPELTRDMVAKIFATDLEDRPALLRALRQTGEEFRRGKIASLPASRAASGD